MGLACGLDVLRCPEAEADAFTIEFVRGLLASLGLSGRLRDHGVQAGQLDALTEQAWEDPCHRTNAVPVTREDLRALYLEVL